MTLQCKKCGFKSPQGSEFCGSCGEDTEFRVEKMARNAALAAEEAVVEDIARGALIPCKTYFPNGRLAEKGFKKPDLADLHDERPTQTDGVDEEWDGPYEWYNEDGQLEGKCTLVAGEPDGLHEFYHENGQLYAKCTYVDGEVDGPSEDYYENGQLERKCTYVAGKKNGPYELYYENGQLKRKCTYVADKENGPSESYYENGQLERKCTYVAGKKGEACESYYENGQLKWKYTRAASGEWHGPYESYHEDGQVEHKGIYNMGKRCGTWIQGRTGFFGGKTTVTQWNWPCPPGLKDGN